jgi:hypothetical protein
MTDESLDVHLLWSSSGILSPSTYASRGEEASGVGGPMIGERGDPREETMGGDSLKPSMAMRP